MKNANVGFEKHIVLYMEVVDYVNVKIIKIGKIGVKNAPVRNLEIHYVMHIKVF